jgi:hypothetical protein
VTNFESKEEYFGRFDNPMEFESMLWVSNSRFEDIFSVISLAMFNRRALSGKLAIFDLNKDALLEKEMDNLYKFSCKHSKLPRKKSVFVLSQRRKNSRESKGVNLLSNKDERIENCSAI